MIVGFTGTRQGPTPAQHKAVDRFLIAMFRDHGARVLVHGGAVHSDTFAHEVVRPLGEIWVFPAIEGGLLSSAVREPFNGIIAEPIPALDRNDIIAGLADGLLAVPYSDTEDERSGTWATVRRARKRGCPVYVVRRDGVIVRDLSGVRSREARGEGTADHRETGRLPLPAKVAHVRRARQTRDHKCHWPGCPEMVPPAKWGCLNHWRRLPKHLRDWIWRTYRVGQEDDMRPSRDYVVAAREVQHWILTEGDSL